MRRLLLSVLVLTLLSAIQPTMAQTSKDEAKLMNYLFSDGSYVETSNDNDDYRILGEAPKNVLLEYFKGN